MGFLRGIEGVPDPARRAPDAPGHEERRRSLRVGQLGVGTLACRRCDAPVALGGAAHGPAEELVCPYCAHRAPLRDFLSLGAPTRPARVVIRVVARRPAGAYAAGSSTPAG